MPLGTDAAIEDLALRLIDTSLPKSEWTHEAHFAAALWLLRHRPEWTGEDSLRALITRYNAATGTVNSDTSGYHHTITLASMRAARARLEAAGAQAALAEVLDALMASPLGRSDWLLDHWTRETLFSVPARRGWIAPNRAALAF